ncbi:SDR family oxidoreductase [bacterium]|nr:SDR family oxidoreductase [bacterium]
MNSYNNIKGTWALITGGAKGIGAQIAESLASIGVNIVITYRNSQVEATTIAKKLSENYCIESLAIKLDSSDKNSVADFFNPLKNEKLIQNLSILVNNAGDYLKKDLKKLSIDEWDFIINQNLMANYYITHYMLKIFSENRFGRVINIGYVNSGASVSKTLITPYYIAKSGIWQLTLSIAKAFGEFNITANMVSPGIMENSESKPTDVPMNRYGKLDEISSAIKYLISDEASYITGTQINVCGGWGL